MSTALTTADAGALLARELAGEFPDPRGRFGPYGGRYVPETLVPALERLEALLPALPPHQPRVAESALTTAADAARLARAGYSLVLVGTALMGTPDPDALVRQMIASGRGAAAIARAARA